MTFMPPIPDFLTLSDRGFVLSDGTPDGCVSLLELRSKVESLAAELSAQFAERAAIGIYADNSPNWVIADLAIQQAGMVAVPVPGFFSSEQLCHVITHSRMAGLLADVTLPKSLGVQAKEIFTQSDLLLYAFTPTAGHLIPPGAAKLTFTSGSTGTPKGILLTAQEQWGVANSLALLLKGISPKRHLALLPMPVLLENVAGLYTSMICGATAFVLPLSAVGLSGSSRFDATAALRAMHQTQCETVILLPQMLKELTVNLLRNPRDLSHLKFMAVGGGKVSAELIHQARRAGLPVYEGYGLTEAGSVVAVNTPQHDRPGSVGKPLEHQSVQIAEDGEILLKNVALTVQGQSDGWFATGDLGHIDGEGFLHVTGRKKNLLITSFGRNISPEWPEALLLRHAEIAQAMVYGEGEPQLSALIVPAQKGHGTDEIARIIREVNDALPDYARIAHWRILSEPFTPSDGTLTQNGRLRRERIAEVHLGSLRSAQEHA